MPPTNMDATTFTFPSLAVMRPRRPFYGCTRAERIAAESLLMLATGPPCREPSFADWLSAADKAIHANRNAASATRGAMEPAA